VRVTTDDGVALVVAGCGYGADPELPGVVDALVEEFVGAVEAGVPAPDRR
jgi:hypothetical protein